MGRHSSGVTGKMEVDGGIYPNVPPGFLAADSARARIKREVNDDGESVMDGIDNLPMSKRMRMLLAGRPSGSSSGSGSSGKVPTCCVDEDVIEEARPSKVAARGSISAVVDRAYIPLKNNPSHQRMRSRPVQASKSSLFEQPCKASSTSRRGRGPTRGLVLERLTRESRVTVEFPQDCLRPVGDNARLFTSQVGVLCRSLIPATTPRWADVTDNMRQLIRQRLQDKFVVDLNVPYIFHAVDDMIKERFKEYRGELHQRYKRCKTHDEAILSAPPHMTIDDWWILCERFSSEAFQKRSRINSANREKLQVNHVAGSKSFVRHRYDMRDSVTSQEPGLVDLYRETHCRQAMGSWVHPRASENWAAMDTIRSQPTPDSSQRSEPDILSEVLGTRSGYVRGLGHGAKLTTLARAASSRSVAGESAICRADIAEREVQELRVVVDEIKEQLERQREEEQRRRKEEEQKWREEKRRREEQERRIEEMRVEHERQMQEMFQALAARFATDALPPPPSSL